MGRSVDASFDFRAVTEGEQMADLKTTAMMEEEGEDFGGPPSPPPPSVGEGGYFRQYKPEQGRWTRVGTFVGCLLLSIGCGKFFYDLLERFEGDEAWRLLVTTGIPALIVAALSAVAWRVSFVKRKSSDFMIATEGEMKKVSWSTRREIIGSTKVVIVLTLLTALLLFIVDACFQALFTWIGVLKT